jgi:NAD(P)H dehydrogenase (quinone)
MRKILILLLVLSVNCKLAAQTDTLASAKPKTILIAYYSKSGHTLKMAQAVNRGAMSTGTKVILKKVNEVTQQDLLEADAIIVGSPVYNANIAPEVQAFINTWPFEGAPLKNKLGAAFVTAGGISAGEETAQLSILRSMLIFGMLVAGGPDWTQAFGASAIHGEASLSEDTMEEYFLIKGEALGKRIGELLLK